MQANRLTECRFLVEVEAEPILALKLLHLLLLVNPGVQFHVLIAVKKSNDMNHKIICVP